MKPAIASCLMLVLANAAAVGKLAADPLAMLLDRQVNKSNAYFVITIILVVMPL